MANHEYVDWYSVKDPHPAAIPNLNNLVSYMIAKGHIENQAPVTPYRLAKDLDKHPKQINSLIKGRPGFVRVERGGNSLGYYWDKATFGGYYPQTFAGHRGRQLLAVESVQAIQESRVKEFNDKLPEMAKQLRAEVAKPDHVLPELGDTKRLVQSIEFNLLPVEIAKDMLQVAVRSMAEGSLNNENATDVMTSLLSLLVHAKG